MHKKTHPLPEVETPGDLRTRLNAEMARKLVGKKIVEARYLTDKEADAVCDGWQKGVVLYLEDGTEVLPVSDPEGNGPGTLFVGDQVFGPL